MHSTTVSYQEANLVWGLQEEIVDPAESGHSSLDAAMEEMATEDRHHRLHVQLIDHSGL